ncbi:hypothetical protein MXD63_31420 [Frankia sp. Cpl3]|nr:hypothetical protein [Frankia sp. Cpl3]
MNSGFPEQDRWHASPPSDAATTTRRGTSASLGGQDAAIGILVKVDYLSAILPPPAGLMATIHTKAPL